MDDENIRRYERATRVQTFGRDHAADIAPGSRIAVLLADLDPIIGKLTYARVGQLRGPVGKPAVIKALTDDFKDISRTARSIALDEPGFPAAAYRHPATSVETPVTTPADPKPRLPHPSRKSEPAGAYPPTAWPGIPRPCSFLNPIILLTFPRMREPLET